MLDKDTTRAKLLKQQVLCKLRACSEFGTKQTFDIDNAAKVVSFPAVQGFTASCAADCLAFVGSTTQTKALPLLVLLWLVVTNRDVEAYLFSEKEKEENRAFYMDIALAISTVYHADKGNPRPDIAAYYQLVGVHPDLYAQALEDRRRTLFGDELYEVWFGASTGLSSPPADNGAVADYLSDSKQLPPRKQPQTSPLKKEAAA